MSTTNSQPSRKPYAVLGSGALTSHLMRVPEEAGSEWGYEFNLFRLRQDGKATHWLRPMHLFDLIKACQVMAFTIADDGWISEHERPALLRLASHLDEITGFKQGSANGTSASA